MRRFYFLFSWFLFFVLGWCSAFAQQTDENPFPTPNTMIGAKPDAKKQGEKEKKILYIVKKDTKETLAGNLCFEEEIRKMGFQYIAVPKGQPPYKNGFSKFWHNLGVKTVLFFKNGPFWKMKVNKKYKECKFGSGDFVG